MEATAIEVVNGGGALARLEDLDTLVSAVAKEARAPSTRRAYRSQWRAFEGWCARHGLCALPASPQTVARYLTDRASEGRKVSTLGQALSAIGEAHRVAKLTIPSPKASPELGEVWRGIRRQIGVSPERKRAATRDVLRDLVASLNLERLIGVRDRALLLLGFGGAFRRSELVALDVGDVAFGDEGMTIRIRRSKTDQEGEGAVIGIRPGSEDLLCPIAALRAWLDGSAIAAGPLLRSVDRHGNVGVRRLSPQAVARRVKEAAAAAGYDPTLVAGHSLRAGLATTAAKRGATTGEIMRQGRWKSAQMVEAVYVRPATVFENRAAGVL